jgi:hypothetical protein
MNANQIAQIATALNVSPNQIKRAEEWKNVLFVVVRGCRARFVSKKVIKMETPKLSKETEKFLAQFDRMVAEGQTDRAVRQAKQLLASTPQALKSCPRADMKQLILNGVAVVESRLAQIN